MIYVYTKIKYMAHEVLHIFCFVLFYRSISKIKYFNNHFSLKRLFIDILLNVFCKREKIINNKCYIILSDYSFANYILNIEVNLLYNIPLIQSKLSASNLLVHQIFKYNL